MVQTFTPPSTPEKKTTMTMESFVLERVNKQQQHRRSPSSSSSSGAILSPVQLVDVFGESIVAVNVWDDYDSFDGIVTAEEQKRPSSFTRRKSPRKSSSSSSGNSKKPRSSSRKRRVRHDDGGMMTENQFIWTRSGIKNKESKMVNNISDETSNKSRT